MVSKFTMTNWYLGTVGFSYKDWAGVFYPSHTPSRQYLAYYSHIFNAVEIDSTFYGTPPLERVKQWAAATPEGFKFCVKTPRQITHEARLSRAHGQMLTFVARMQQLGPKLGAILIQLPPSLTIADQELVLSFVTKLPAEVAYALEFRHLSWFTPATAELLGRHHLAWTSTSYLDLPQQIIPTTDFLYIRWLGRHGQFPQKDREQIDIMPQLRWWQNEIRPYLSRVSTIYGFFNNDFSGHSPRTCNRFKALVGQPVKQPDLPHQGRLF
jgi:uncharacterized protein YecE (DUF72 family)